jgi:hypothetical protein
MKMDLFRMVTYACTVLCGLSQAQTNRITSNSMRMGPAITDADWVGVGPSAGFELGRFGDVNDLAIDNRGILYIGGMFYKAGGMNIPDIAKWDGSAWSALGSGLRGRTRALAIDKNANLYAAGWFDSAGGIPARNIAKWNGSAWSALGNGIYGEISALAIDGKGILYAAGRFDTAGGIPARNIAKWDGGAWSALGSGISEASDIGVGISSLKVDNNNNLYAAGFFDTAGGIPASNIAKWDGSAWSALGSGIKKGCGIGQGGDTGNSISAFAVDAHDNLYVAKVFDTAEGIYTFGIAKWDGSGWSSLHGGANGVIYDLAADYKGVLYLCGSFDSVGGIPAYGIAQWDGSGLSSPQSAARGDVRHLGLDGKGNLFAFGRFSFAGGDNVAAEWNGAAWTILCRKDGKGLNGAIKAFAIDSMGNVYAGGWFGLAGIKAINCIAKWDGGAWSALGSGVGGFFGGNVQALIIHKNILYAGGTFDSAGGIPAHNIAKWDGSAWSAVGSGVGDSAGSVYALAFDKNGNLYAGGIFNFAGSSLARNIAKWDGSAWSALGSGIEGPTNAITVTALAVDKDGALYAGGIFNTAGGIPAHNIAKWNGASWSAVGSGTYGDILSMATDKKGNIYAGGRFNFAGSVSAHNIAKWDGSAWSAIGSAYGDILSIAVDDNGNVYASGSIYFPGTETASHIAMWDGGSWSTLGSGVDAGYDNSGGVYALIINNNTLYAGGIFDSAGGKVSNNFALCRLPATQAAHSPPDNNARTYLSHDAETGRVRVHLESTTDVHFRLYSFSGRTIYSASEKMAAGEHAYRIKATGLAPGAYIAQVKAGSESMRWKTVKGR